MRFHLLPSIREPICTYLSGRSAPAPIPANKHELHTHKTNIKSASSLHDYTQPQKVAGDTHAAVTANTSILLTLLQTLIPIQKKTENPQTIHTRLFWFATLFRLTIAAQGKRTKKTAPKALLRTVECFPGMM